MSTESHVEFKAEVQRIEETKAYLENTIRTLMERRTKFKQEIKEAYIELDFLDSSLSYSTIMLNSTLLDGLEKNFDLLMEARKKPYFARMDIQHKDKKNHEKIYIGKVSLSDTSMETPMVVDWRAPIASVYYDGRLGTTTYAVGNQEYSIDLQLKRQYTIEEGKLLHFMDVDISTSDAFLQASLEGHASEKLKDIVSTIQAEQNQIIRADIQKPLIVQGAAGSGKTTIALHRIAYLIYTYAETFSPEEFMIIGPNRLFLDYISGVLPELGAKNVEQTTYSELMMSLIGKKIKLTDGNQKLNELIRTDSEALAERDKTLLSAAAGWKNSMLMKEVIDQYIAKVEREIFHDAELAVEDILLLSAAEISTLYYQSYGYQPIYKRVTSIKNYLTQYTRNRVKKVLAELEDSYAEKISQVRRTVKDSAERKLKIVELMDEREDRLGSIKKSAKTVVKKFMAQFVVKDLFVYYLDMLSNLDELGMEEVPAGLFRYIVEQTEARSSKKQFEVEDLAPIVYLKQRLFGLDESLQVKMVVVDEAQDFSSFQFYVLRQVLNTERFTILGDLAQGIHMYRSVRDWEYLRTHIFDNEANYLTLEQSYRTTIEIMEEANYILTQVPGEQLILAKPVVRSGERPLVREFDNRQDLIRGIADQIRQWLQEEFTTLAVVAKSNQEAKMIHRLLAKELGGLQIALIDEQSNHFGESLLVIPAHLAKGLEFDAVIVAAAEESYGYEPLDVKLMYVAMTRAMHRLAVLYQKNRIVYYDAGAQRGRPHNSNSIGREK